MVHRSEDLISRSDLCRELNVKTSTLTYWRLSKVVPEPTHKFGKKLYYNRNEANEILKMLNFKRRQSV